MWNVDLLDTHLYLLETDIPSKHFVCLHNAFKTSSRLVFQTSSRQVLKRCSRHLQGSNFSSSKTSSRDLSKFFKMSWKTKNCYGEDVLKMSSRPFQDQQIFAWLPVFTCTWAIGNLWSIGFGVNILESFIFFFFWKYCTFGSIKNYLLPFVKSI